MRTCLKLLFAALAAVTCHAQAWSSEPAAPTSAAQLGGLWHAKRVFGPQVGGTLRIIRSGDAWTGEIAGKTVPVRVSYDGIAFELPNGSGTFLGILEEDESRIDGHWIQPVADDGGGPFASYVSMPKHSPNEWRGSVWPLETGITFYLVLRSADDGSVGAFLRNPERNIGHYQYPVDRLELDANVVRLIAGSKDGKSNRVLAEGRYDRENDRISIYLPSRGGNFDFRRVGEQEYSDFYPRGRPSVKYSYSPPPRLDDGWPSASLEDVGIDRAAITGFIQKLIDTPMDSAKAPEIHGVLIARYGKLVLEEYFHGEHREKPHDTRSAGKSLAADIAGAAIQAGHDASASMPVYTTMYRGAPPDLDPRKRALTLEHLLTMSSGLDCDEDDESSPGNEENLKGPDIYRATLDLEMVRQPGEKAVYCSVGANLAGGVVARAARQPSLHLFQQLIADPLEIKKYYMGVSPTHDYYLGGGARLLPRDFLKLAQVHLNGGTWNGRRVYSTEWSRLATSPLVRFAETSKSRYGYLWWVYDFPYRGRTVRAYFASGNGGQFSLGIDELDLAIVFYGGNYSDWEAGFVSLLEYVPKDILPAVQEQR